MCESNKCCWFVSNSLIKLLSTTPAPWLLWRCPGDKLRLKLSFSEELDPLWESRLRSDRGRNSTTEGEVNRSFRIIMWFNPPSFVSSGSD